MAMNTKKTVIVVAVCMAAALAFFSSAQAAVPSVSASATGSGDTVSLLVSGDPNASVVLNYLGLSSAVQASAIGTTNANGSFSATISSATYGITPNSLFYVTVNNQRSTSVVWPYIGTTQTSGTISLSQTSLTLAIGQSATITANNNAGSSLYLSSNSNPAVANMTLSGNQFVVSANTAGSTTATVCSLASTSNCASITVTVPGGATQQLTFSQNNVTVAVGQTLPITVAGGTGIYSIASNSNTSAFQATINGSIVNVLSLIHI